MEKVRTREELEKAIEKLDDLLNEAHDLAVENVEKQFQLSKEYEALIDEVDTLINVREIVQQELYETYKIVVIKRKGLK